MSLRHRWQRLDHFWRHAAVNLLLAVLIEILLHAFHRTGVVQQAENAGLDAAISFFGARGSSAIEAGRSAFTVLDIDEATWRGWRSPLLTPRDKLLRLLRTATAARPAAVLVDLDLTLLAGPDGLRPGPGDSALARFLAGYRGPAPLILMRPLLPDLTQDRLPRPLPAWFEPLPDSAVAWIGWGTAQYVEEPDGVVRRWRLWEPACRDGAATLLPSIQLQTTAALDPTITPQQLDAALAAMAPASCLPTGSPAPGGELTVLGHRLQTRTHELGERIVYSLRWPPESGPVRMVRLPGGNVVPALLRIPAAQVADAAEPPDPRLLEGRVVLIGGSYAASRDWYATPLGRMPGMAIVLNAVASLERYGQYGERSSPLKWLVTAALVVAASLAYARFHPLVATLLLLPLVYLAVLPISFYLFESGVWLDFTAPVLAAQLHELIASAEDAWALRGKRLERHSP